jgi:hypothetical protein
MTNALFGPGFFSPKTGIFRGFPLLLIIFRREALFRMNRAAKLRGARSAPLCVQMSLKRRVPAAERG